MDIDLKQTMILTSYSTSPPGTENMMGSSNRQEEYSTTHKVKWSTTPLHDSENHHNVNSNSGADHLDDDDNTSVTSMASCDSDSSTIRAMKITMRQFDSLCNSLEVASHEGGYGEEGEQYSDYEDNDNNSHYGLKEESVESPALPTTEAQEARSSLEGNKYTNSHIDRGKKERQTPNIFHNIDTAENNMLRTISLAEVSEEEGEVEEANEQKFKQVAEAGNGRRSQSCYYLLTIQRSRFFSTPASFLKTPQESRCVNLLEHQFNYWSPRWWN